MQGEPRRAGWARLSLGALLLAVAACGGSGGGGDAAPAPGPTAPAPPTPAADTLQAHLAACPSGPFLNTAMACMVGLYEGTTTDTGAYCAFRYDADAISYYLAAGQTLRVGLSLLNAGSTYEKRVENTATGYSLSFSVGIASGSDMDLSYPAVGGGLLIEPKKAGVAACRVTQGPSSAATGSASTSNLLGRNWQDPALLNGSNGALGTLATGPAFDAGMADDGRAVVVFRQADTSGRMAVQAVTGNAGKAGTAPSWSAPQVLDTLAPLVNGSLRPRVAVSRNGHAVAAWFAELPCAVDAYEPSPAGKTCRTLVASRRLAHDSAWEAPVVVATAPPMAVQDHLVRINAAGDVVLAFPGFYRLGTPTVFNGTMLGVRNGTQAGYRVVRLFSFRSNYTAGTAPLAQTLQAALDDDGRLMLAGESAGAFGDLTWVHADTHSIGSELRSDATAALGVHAYAAQTSGGYAAYSWRQSSGPYKPLQPERLSLFSPHAPGWLSAQNLDAYAMWGDTSLVGTDTPGGEFLLYSGCKLTAWRAGSWGSTRSLPGYCGRDRSGGLYAFNRQGDYLGLHWAGRAGQWGYYSLVHDQLLKGAPGTGAAVAGDFLLGTASDLFGSDTSQLLLAPGGLALAVTANTYTTLPSAAQPAGVPGSAVTRLWAVYLK